MCICDQCDLHLLSGLVNKNMFKKPIKIKSNTQVKGSERKNFKDLLLKSFPNLTESDLNDFLPKKEILNNVKIVTHDDVIVQVYTVQKRAMIFDVRGRIFPTIYLLWKFSNIAHVLTTHQPVMTYISSGADLMLPGVVTPPAQSGLSKYGNINENDVVYVNLSNNQAAIAVGVASQSSASMALANSRGKCVIIHHFYGDNLCTLEGMPILQVPDLGPPYWLKLKSFDEDFPPLGTTSGIKIHSLAEVLGNDVLGKGNEQNVTEKCEEPELLIESPDDMDNTLRYCFLGAIKYSKFALPILTSNFFKLHMLPLCPENKSLDIKKTSFKKLKPFLEIMAEEGIIALKEIKKGVEAISAVNQSHPKYSEFYISRENRPCKEVAAGETTSKTDVTENYVITQNVLPLFQLVGYQKGDTISGPNIRKYITKYVKENNLQEENNCRLVRPKNVLATVCKTENLITWEELIEKVCDSMKNCYVVKTSSEEIVNKGKVSPITISVSVRSGNKKVTLVDNLELFGIRLADFAKECQHGVAASTSISRPRGKKSDQLLIQGNQVLFVYNLLTDKYKVPKKYVLGLENAPKKKN